MTLLFYLCAAVLLASALGVILMRNPVHSALFLIANLLTVAIIFAMLEAHFLAAVQVVVYAGAIMVLVLFVLMLLNIKDERPRRQVVGPAIASCIAAIGFIAMAVPVLRAGFSAFDPSAGAVNAIQGTAKAMGELLYSKYVFPFEAASVLIMAALVGAVMLGRKVPTTQSLETTKPEPVMESEEKQKAVG